MCGGSKAPEPQAPPAPVPVRDSKLDAYSERQRAARRAAASGYSSTMLTGAGGLQEDAPTTSPVLGGG